MLLILLPIIILIIGKWIFNILKLINKTGIKKFELVYELLIIILEIKENLFKKTKCPVLQYHEYIMLLIIASHIYFNNS